MFSLYLIKIIDLEDSIVQLKEDLVHEREEARQEKEKLKQSVVIIKSTMQSIMLFLSDFSPVKPWVADMKHILKLRLGFLQYQNQNPY